VRTLEAKSFSEAEALAQLGFQFIGIDENKKVFQFKDGND